MAKQKQRETYRKLRERFVRTWQAASSVKEVSDAMSMTISCCTSKASFLRKKGIPLKKFLGGWAAFDEDERDHLRSLCNGEADK